MRDYKKTSSMLPTPSRDATIVVRYDGDSPSYCRSFLTGPVDTPYFGGIFVFDIYFPKEFPHVPPQVQFINTGTERFHVNLYECGKVCTSLLGTSIGDTSERWDPGVSSLGQILVSIQSLILGEYHTAAIGRQVTNDNRRLSIDAYAEFRLMTNRYAVNRILQCCRGEGMYSSSFQEFRPIFRRFLFAIRHKLLQSIESYVRDSRTTKTIVNKLLVEVKQLVQEFSLTE